MSSGSQVDQYYVRHSIKRPSSEVVHGLSQFAVATVHEAMGPGGLMAGLAAVTPGRAACGPVVTSLSFAGDNLMLHAAVEACQPGDILAVSTTAPSQHGMFGELLATLCIARGIAGVIVDAGVRDTAALRQCSLPVWSKIVSAAGTKKLQPGRVNGPIVCAGVAVMPGDVAVADDDGVVIVPREKAPQVLAASRAREDGEGALRRRFEAGELSVDVLGLRVVLKRLGVTNEP